MDLRHDWKTLNEVLFQRDPKIEGAASSVVLLEDDGKIVDGAVSNGRTFLDRGSEAVSASKDQLDALSLKYGADQAVVLKKKEFDQFVIEVASLGSNYFQQLQTLRAKIYGQLDRKKDGLVISRRHFLLELFGQKLRRILPRRFNVLLFIDERSSTGQAAPFSYKAIMLSYSNGQLDEFFEPDFSSLHENRLMHWDLEHAAIGQYLESRYILPCCAIFVHRDDWERCLAVSKSNGRPWAQFVKFYDEARAAVYPNNLITKALLAVQRIMVYFGRL